MVTPSATAEEVERTTELATVPPLNLDAYSLFRYIVDVDSGLGSSRKPGILSSRSPLLTVESL